MSTSTARRCEACAQRGRVVDTRNVGPLIRRRIECQKGHRWTTVEIRPAVHGKRVKNLELFKAMAT